MQHILQPYQAIEAPYQSHFRFKQHAFTFSMNDKAVQQDLDRYFSEWKVEEVENPTVHIKAVDTPIPAWDIAFNEYRETGKKRIKEKYLDVPGFRIIHKVKTGVHFAYSSGGAHLAFGPVKQYSNQLINFANALFMELEMQENAFLFHAAGVAVDGKGVVLAAPSGKGKSTTAMHLMNAGTSLVSNDRIVLQKTTGGYTMVGVPKHPRVNPGTLLNNPTLRPLLKNPERFAGMSKAALWEVEEKYDAVIPDLYGPNRFQLAADAKALVIIDWEDEGLPLHLERITLQDFPQLMPAITKAPSVMTPQLHEERKNDSDTAYQKFLTDLPVYRLAGKMDAKNGVELVLGLLGGE